MSNSLLNAASSLLDSIGTAGYVQQTDPYSMSHLAEQTREYEKNFKENKRRYDQERQDNLDLLKKMEDNEAKIMAFREKMLGRKSEDEEEEYGEESLKKALDYINNTDFETTKGKVYFFSPITRISYTVTATSLKNLLDKKIKGQNLSKKQEELFKEYMFYMKNIQQK